MSHNTVANLGTGGDTFNTVDLALNTYPTNGKVPSACIYVSPNDTTAPTPVTDTNPLPVDGTVAATQSGTWTVGLSAAQTLATVTTVGTVTTVSTVTNLSQLGGAAVPIGAGLEATAVRVTLPTDGTGKVSAAQSGTWNVTNVSGTVSLPTGASTSANQATEIASLASIDGKITACNTGAVVLTTSTASIGKLASNTGVTIGAVEIAAAQTLATVTTVSTVTNLSQLGGVAIAMNTGVRSTGTQRVTIATDDIVPASQSGTWTVQPGNTANTTAWLVNDNPVTSGGLSVSSFLSTAAVQSTSVKASAGQVYSVEFFNINATPVYVRLYNNASADSGAGTPVWRGIVPGNTAAAGFVKTWDKGLAFGTGIAMRCTGAIADADTTALAANTVIGNVCYK